MLIIQEKQITTATFHNPINIYLVLVPALQDTNDSARFVYFFFLFVFILLRNFGCPLVHTKESMLIPFNPPPHFPHNSETFADEMRIADARRGSFMKLSRMSSNTLQQTDICNETMALRICLSLINSTRHSSGRQNKPLCGSHTSVCIIFRTYYELVE